MPIKKSKNIVVVSCVAPPETVVAGRVNYDICEYFSQKGNTVTLITPFPSRPLGKFEINKPRGNAIVYINENFVHVRINSFQCPNFNLFKRVYESFDFGIKAVKYVNNYLKKADLIFATPWPFLGQIVFVKFRKNKEIPLIMNVQDLYPESFFTKFNSRFFNYIKKPLISIDKYIALHSSHLSVVSESMKNVYIKSRNINPSKVSIVENWQNEEEFLKLNISKDAILKKYNLELLEDKFIFMYLGNIGPVAGLEKVIHEFALMDKSNSYIIIAGSGTAKKSCMDLVESYSLDNVIFVDIPTGLESVVELQSISDVLLLPIQPDASSSSIPSKLIAYMFSSKPVLTSAKHDSTTGIAISENNCGFLVNDQNSWSNQMSKILLMDQTELKKMGSNAFNYGISRYSKKSGLLKIDNLFNKIANKD